MTLAIREQIEIGEAPVDEERTSDILRRMAGTGGTGHITVREMTAVLGDRAFGVIVLALALPNCVFAPPGFGGITGLLTSLFGGQLAVGYERPHLPAWVERRRFSRAGFHRILQAVLPSVRRFERLARPRLSWVVSRRAERIIGGYMVLQALIVALPIPLTNWLPGLSLAAIAAGLIERDGAAVLVGVAIGIAAVVVAIVVTSSFVAGAAALLGLASG